MSDGFAPIPETPTSLSPRRPSGIPVFVAGTITTGLALFGVSLAEANSFNVMGYYADYVIPIGATLVGLCAASGFGIASFLTGTKISGRVLAGTLAILTIGYFGAQWFAYYQSFPFGGVTNDGQPMNFFTWFDLTTRGIYFESDHGEPNSPLGLLGYGVRALEILGFVGGGVLIPFLLRSKPFCDACSRYMKTKQVATMPAGLGDKLIGNKSPEREAERARLAESSKQSIVEIFESGGKDAGALRDALAKHGVKKGGPVRVEVHLVRCAGCNSGYLSATRVAQQGRNVQKTALGKKVLQPAVVEGLV